MSEEEVAVVRRALKLFIAGDIDAASLLWAEDATGIPPMDWPEASEMRGREAVRDQPVSWNEIFGAEWTRSMSIKRLEDLGEGRILGLFGFESSGVASGVPVDQELAAIYTVEGGMITVGEFFMSWAEAREAAGVG